MSEDEKRFRGKTAPEADSPKVVSLLDRHAERMAKRLLTEQAKKAVEGIQMGREGKKVVIRFPRSITNFKMEASMALGFAKAMQESAE